MNDQRDTRLVKQRAYSRKAHQKAFAKRLKFFRGMQPIWRAALFQDKPDAYGKRDAIGHRFRTWPD